jgi:hypothetical protein
VPFQPNDAATARCFGHLNGVSPEIKTQWRSEGDSSPRDSSGFEGRNSARVWRLNSGRKKASALERTCSSGIRRCFGSLRFPFGRKAYARNLVTSNIRRRFGVRNLLRPRGMNRSWSYFRPNPATGISRTDCSFAEVPDTLKGDGKESGSGQCSRRCT